MSWFSNQTLLDVRERLAGYPLITATTWLIAVTAAFFGFISVVGGSHVAALGPEWGPNVFIGLLLISFFFLVPGGIWLSELENVVDGPKFPHPALVGLVTFACLLITVGWLAISTPPAIAIGTGLATPPVSLVASLVANDTQRHARRHAQD